jgi:hypothetical protein
MNIPDPYSQAELSQPSVGQTIAAADFTDAADFVPLAAGSLCHTSGVRHEAAEPKVRWTAKERGTQTPTFLWIEFLACTCGACHCSRTRSS